MQSLNPVCFKLSFILNAVIGNTADSVILKKNINDFYTENQNLNFENKGFKILNNMGWTKGKGLGKNEQGIQEPVNL